MYSKVEINGIDRNAGQIDSWIRKTIRRRPRRNYGDIAVIEAIEAGPVNDWIRDNAEKIEYLDYREGGLVDPMLISTPGGAVLMLIPHFFNSWTSGYDLYIQKGSAPDIYRKWDQYADQWDKEQEEYEAEYARWSEQAETDKNDQDMPKEDPTPAPANESTIEGDDRTTYTVVHVAINPNKQDVYEIYLPYNSGKWIKNSSGVFEYITNKLEKRPISTK